MNNLILLPLIFWNVHIFFNKLSIRPVKEATVVVEVVVTDDLVALVVQAAYVQLICASLSYL